MASEALHHIKMASWRSFQTWCKTFSIDSLAQLNDAPLRIKKMLYDRGMKARMHDKFHKMRTSKIKPHPKQVQVYANEVEEEEMNKCHRASVTLLETLLDGLPKLDNGRALEVAAGNAQLTKDLLRMRFKEIDCFDQCPKGVQKIEKLQARYDVIKKVDQATMQSYTWEEQYTGVFIRWCCGYLTKEELIDFLKTAAAHLY